MDRSMASGKIGSKRQDYFTHVRLMLGRFLTKTEAKTVDRMRRDGVGFVLIAEEIALGTGEPLMYPKHYLVERRASSTYTHLAGPPAAQ